MQFSNNDGLPPYLCEECIFQLVQFYQFKLKCENTYRKLKTASAELKKPTNDEIELFAVQQLLKPKERSIEDADSDFEIKTEFEELDIIFKEDCKPNFISITDEHSVEFNDTQQTQPKSKRLRHKPKQNIQRKKKPSIRAVDLCCDICQSTVKHVSSIEKHMRNEHGMAENLRPCPHCGKSFNRNRLVSHINQHAKQCKCDLCFNTFQTPANLRRHMQTVHQQLRPFACDICHNTFTAKYSMLHHIATVHYNQSNYVCAVCDQRFKTKSQLNGHEACHFPDRLLPFKKPKKTKSLERQYICTYCGKVSNSCSIHTYHTRMHTGQKPYECKLCFKRFRAAGPLKIHGYIHTGEKPYACKICDMRFRQVGHFRTHQLTHTAEKPFMCEDCGKRFAWKCNYAAHKRLHTGEKPYQCELCEERFIDSKVLKKHRLRCVGVPPEV